MALHEFIWTDLSTYDVALARADYTTLFDWSIEATGGYDLATAGGQPVAGLFEMPEVLAQKNMPSFWMSYVHVARLQTSIDRARAHDGVRVEVGPQTFDAHSRFALLRDPSGAGFSIYEGPELAAPTARSGVVAMRYHHVDDVRRIQPFYETLFGWEFEVVTQTEWPLYEVRHPQGRCIAYVEEVPEEIRGSFCYWMPAFRVRSMQDTVAKCQQNGGQMLFALPGGRVMLRDQQGAHFMVIDT